MPSQKKPLTALVLSLALMVPNAPAAFAAESGISVDLTAQTDAPGHYLPPADTETVSYYFLMPRGWCSEQTNLAGVNWTYRETGKDLTAPVCRVASGFRAYEEETPLVFRADVPDYLSLTDEYYDVTLGSLTWTNYLRDTGSADFHTLSPDIRDVTTDLSPSADSESKIRDDRLFSHGYQGQRSADDGFWRYLGESYRGDKAALGDYAGNFYTTFENDPDGRLCLRHDNMIYLPDKGEWFFYFGNACGTYPTEEDSRTRGSYFMLDTAPAPEAKNPAYPLFSDYRADAPATIDEGGYEEHTETVGGFLCFFGKRYNEDTDAYDKYVRIDGFIGADAAVTVPAEIKGIPVTRFRLGEADAVTSVTLPASLLNEANRDGLSRLNRLPKLTSITLDGKSDSGFVSGSAVYLSDGTMTELIAAARQREGKAWSIPEGVTSIGTGIVCDTAKSLILPASLQNADGNMILSALENVTIAKGNASFRVIGGALYHLGENGKPDSLVLLPEKSGIKALDIPEGVRQVGKLRCDTLEAICFPASAQTITTFSHGIGSSRLSALREIDVAAGNPCFTSEYGVLYGVECSIDEARGTFVATDGGKPAYFAACPDSYPSETLTLPDSVSGFIAPLTCDAVRAVVFPKNWKTDSESGDILRFLNGHDTAVICYPDSDAERYCIEKNLPYLPAGITPGDVNGDGLINVSDATLTQQLAAELYIPLQAQKTAADVNRDGKIDVSDATMIQQFAADIIHGFD